MSLKNNLLYTLSKKNPTLYDAIQHAIFKSKKSTGRNDTIFIIGIRNFLILFIDGGSKNAIEVFANLKENEENFKNKFIHKANETKTIMHYYLNIDLDDKKIYYSKEFLNENKQITRDIFEIKLTNIGKETLKKNFKMIHDECSKCNTSKDKNLIKLEIPFNIVNSRAVLADNRYKTQHNNNLIDNKKLDEMTSQFLTNIRNELNTQNTLDNNNISKKRKPDDNDYEDISDNESPAKIVKFTSSGKGQWI